MAAVTGLTPYAAHTYTVGLYDITNDVYVDIYTGKCIADADGKATLRLDGILRDYAYRQKRTWKQTIQGYVPAELTDFTRQAYPIEDGSAFLGGVCCVRVYDSGGTEVYNVYGITTWAGWLAPWQVGEVIYAPETVTDLALVGNTILPHIPPVYTSRMWLTLALLWLDTNGVKPQIGTAITHPAVQTNGPGGYVLSFTLATLFETLAQGVDGGSSSTIAGDTLDGGDSDDIAGDTIDGGDSTTPTIAAVDTDIMCYYNGDAFAVAHIDECAAPFYVCWQMPSGGWMSWPMWGNTTFAGAPSVTAITDLDDSDRVIGMDAQPTATLHSAFVTRDEYNLLCTMGYAREVYVYDSGNDTGAWCSVETRGMQTAGNKRWAAMPFAVTLKQLKHTNL